ncbi:hypothetical protein M3E13_00730 [Oceanobacillus kimchii]|uniref:hypothetical protein n=1 Tax=Oceanobacillus TaxID=182709 RepID=UPI00084E4237|nr:MULTISPECIES: hypothetical protein [Oceanobacillus]MCT1578248.1 hypothetical protein [Oceanobacillus kimchii]MCT2134426.1 hypothetical protein [Oceanobacillus kimchii]OEH54948.1 hypothetical protein AQ616_07835 [Oceanobacillus sp. E9]
MNRKRHNSDLKWKSVARKTLVIFFLLIGCTIHVTFANTDMQSLISSWFDTKTDESVKTMEEELNRVKQQQLERLQMEIRSQMDTVDQELQILLDQQIMERSSELEQYADEIIQDIEISPNNINQELQIEMDAIIIQAKDDMDLLRKNNSIQNDNIIESEKD